MDKPPPSEAPPAAAVVRRAEGKRPLGTVIGVGLLGASVAFYYGLGSGLRRSSVDEDAEGFRAKSAGSPGGGASPSMRDEVSFQRQRQLAEERKAKAAEELARQFGRSSVVYLKPGTAADSSGRLHYDDVGKGAGKSVSGILRPREARRQPNALQLEQPEMEGGLKSPIGSGQMAGELPEAGRAKDAAPTTSASLSPARFAEAGFTSAETPQGIPVAAGSSEVGGGPERKMRIVNRGGIDGNYTLSKAVNADRAKVKEAISSAEVPKIEAPQTLAVEQEQQDRLQKFSGSEAVGQAVASVERGDAKKSQIAKLTSAQVYGKLGAGKGAAHESRAELGGVVFDGKRPPEAKLAGGDESQVGGGGGPGFGAADKLEEELQGCRDAERAAAVAMQRLTEAGKEVRRTDVKEARELNYSCHQKRLKYEECIEDCENYKGDKKPDCNKKCKGPKNAWKRETERLDSGLRGIQDRIRSGALTRLCQEFDRLSAAKQAKCASMRGEALQYGSSCQTFVETPIDDARECYVPNAGYRCDPTCSLPPRG